MEFKPLQLIIWAVMATVSEMDTLRIRQSAAQSVVIRTNSLKMVVVPLTSPFRKYRSFSCYNRSPSFAEVELRLQAASRIYGRAAKPAIGRAVTH